jgi:hypothetical protein
MSARRRIRRRPVHYFTILMGNVLLMPTVAFEIWM